MDYSYEDMSFECDISLSKKLRAIIGDSEATVTLVSTPIKNGQASATLIVSSANIDMNVANQSLGKETSIQLTLTSVKDEVPGNPTITNLFSTGNHTNGPRTVVDRVAVTKAPERTQISHAVKRAEEIVTPEEFPEYEETQFISFVSSFSELMMAVKAAQGKESEIDLDKIDDPRQKAIAKEIKEQAESIDMPAYIVNDSCASLSINDMDLSLVLNTPFNLSNISAKRLQNSGDLKAMIRQKLVKFINPDEIGKYMNIASKGVEQPVLDIYDRDGAIDASRNNTATAFPDATPMDILVNDDVTPSEQEQLAGLINLTSMGDASAGGSRTTFHGDNSSRERRTVGKDLTENAQGIKTIRKKV